MKAIFSLITTLLLSILFINGCSGLTSNSIELNSVQIKDYQGEKLDSIELFRENSIKGPQTIDITNYHLNITGLVDKPLSYTYDEVINKYQSYKKVLTIDCVEGWSVKVLWEGLQIKDILNKSGIKPESKVVIFHAYDGYTTSLPLQYVLDNNLLLAYKMNGVTLPPERGFPFELVAEAKWGYKWIKWVTEIELSNNVDYKGYWESAGYSNDASLDKPFFDR
jgi:DMSO/TMAO reductase YedYZ molybdopterin-dependent catalytic subunit